MYELKNNNFQSFAVRGELTHSTGHWQCFEALISIAGGWSENVQIILRSRLQFSKEEAKTQNKTKMLLPISSEEFFFFFNQESSVKMNVWVTVSRRLLRSEDWVMKFSAFTREAKKQEARIWKGRPTKSNSLFSFPTNISRNIENIAQKDSHQDHFNWHWKSWNLKFVFMKVTEECSFKVNIKSHHWTCD